MQLTIFTPIYNRAYLINNLFESLIRQTNHDFIWMIVDDGSTDNIQQVVEECKKKAVFEIIYIYQPNQGKHVAHNTAVENCNTTLFFCVDSDDFLTDDAVDKIYDAHKKYDSFDVLGYFFRKADTKGEISGGNFQILNEFIGLREIYFKYRFSGELAIVFRTELIRKYSFPVYDREKFVTEKILYNELSFIAPMIYVDEVIYIFEYQQSGYTLNSNRLLIKNPIGGAMGYLSDAVYGTVFIDRAKSYGTFIAMKKVFDISDELYMSLKPPIMIRIVGKMCEPHYKKLFQKLKMIY